jgi:hypothetical protein
LTPSITALEPSGEVSEAAEVLVMDGMTPIDELTVSSVLDCQTYLPKGTKR